MPVPFGGGRRGGMDIENTAQLRQRRDHACRCAVGAGGGPIDREHHPTGRLSQPIAGADAFADSSPLRNLAAFGSSWSLAAFHWCEVVADGGVWWCGYRLSGRLSRCSGACRGWFRSMVLPAPALGCLLYTSPSPRDGLLSR